MAGQTGADLERRVGTFAGRPSCLLDQMGWLAANSEDEAVVTRGDEAPPRPIPEVRLHEWRPVARVA